MSFLVSVLRLLQSRFPAKYIYEPWRASPSDQKAWGCVIGKDYPFPIVDHTEASQRCMKRMKEAYDRHAAQSVDKQSSISRPSPLNDQPPRTSRGQKRPVQSFLEAGSAGQGGGRKVKRLGTPSPVHSLGPIDRFLVQSDDPNQVGHP
jgi:hypothetical protein